MTKEEMREAYVDRVLSEAKAYVENSMSDVKMLMNKEDYEESFNELVSVFIAGADCAKRVLTDVLSEYKKGNSV